MIPSAERVVVRFLEAHGVEANKTTMQVGDRVEVRTKRLGWVLATISQIDHNWNARTWPYLVRSVTDDGSDFHGKRKSLLYADNPNMKYKGRSRKKKILEESRKRKTDKAQRGKDRADAGSASLESWKLKPGDVIVYNYRNGNRRETVAKLNFKTGKVGIERFSEYQKEIYLKELQDRRDRKELLQYVYGLSGGRGTSNRSVRWLPATGIVSVHTRA